MSAHEELCFLSIEEAGRLYRERKLSPVELTRAHLERIAALNPRFHAYITVMAGEALAAAQTAETELSRDLDLGPLHGIPVAVKDLIDVRGVKTTAASGVLKDVAAAKRDATVVSMLSRSGAAVLGKLNLHEFAYGGPGPDAAFPAARNPWNPAFSPGGSSSGSGVAAALGLAMGTLGTDTGGSIRMPASCCGVAGLKPTLGRVSRAGVVPLSWSLDHVGPICRSAEDAAIVLQSAAGYDPADPWSSRSPVPDFRMALREGVKGLRIGVPRQFFFDQEGSDPEVMNAVEKALTVLKGLGASLDPVSIPAIRFDYAAGALILFGEAYTYHEKDLRERPGSYGENLRNRLRSGMFIGARDYMRAQQVRALIKAQFQAVLQEVDLLVTPTMPQPPAPLNEPLGTGPARGPMVLRPFNMAGLPGISVPCGFTEAGLPIGLHIGGRPFDESTVLRAAHAYEQATDWHRRRPVVE